MSSATDATKRDRVIADLNRHIFVFVSNENAEPAAVQRLTDAYGQLTSLDIPVTWHQTTESLPSQDANFPVVFVMEPFGTAFFLEIKQDFRIISPMCLLTSLNDAVKIPISSCRCLANLALRDCIVSSSCFSKEEVAEIERRVKLMGGIYSRNLMNNTTHLITEEVHSQKYSSACEIRIPVVLRSWLDEAWTLSSSNPKFVALNRSFTKRHRCPVFRKCNVVVTTFIGNERVDVIGLLQSNGAHYSANIAVEGEHQTTHLVAKRSGSQKFASAAKSCLRIVTKEWVTDSIEEGYRLPECEYQIATCASASATRSGSAESEGLSETLNQLELEQRRCEPILDGYRVYLCGFSETQMQRAKQILNLCKATRLSRLSCDVTHVVLGCPTPEQRSKVACFSPPPSYVLRYHWLVDCCKQKTAVPESEYLVVLSDGSGAESSRVRTAGQRHRGEQQAAGNSELFSQYTKEEKILSNYYFLLIDPEPSLVDATKQLILNNGGNLVTEGSTSLANYTIVPVDFDDYLDITTRLVTLYWLESSLFVKRLLPMDKHALYAPAQDFGCKAVLSGLLVSVLAGRDNYVECVCAIQMLRYMGARNSLQLKRTNPDRTELVITDDTNQEAVRLANEWNIPVVKLDWVYDCAMKKDRLPFDSYLHPSSQPTVDAPIRSPVLFSPDKSKIVVLGPTFDLEDAEIYFPHGTTPQIKNPSKPRSVNSQLAEMYTSNLESLTIRDFAAKPDAPTTTSSFNISNKVPISEVLKGTKIAFASRFTPQELNQMTNIVSELSGISCSSYCSEATHYIYVGKHSSWAKEAMLAKKENKYVVHPQWLTDAKKLGKRLDEINYPPSFNPNNSIGYFKIEKLPEPERRNIPEPMDTSHSSELISHSASRLSFITDDSTSDRSMQATSTEDIVDVQELSLPHHQQHSVSSARRKRMRKSSIPTEGNPDSFDVSLSLVTPPPPEPKSPRFKVNLSTQEVYDNFDNQSRDLEEADLSPSVPQPLHGRWLKSDSINEFKIPIELRRLSSPYQQKRYLVQNYHELQESRERVGWDPLPYLEDSPPQTPSIDPPVATVPTVSEPARGPDMPSLDTVPSIDNSRKLRNSSSLLSTSVRATNSPLTSSQSQGHFFVFSNISSDNRTKMGEVISRLGGKHSCSTSYDFKCTHMICGEIASYEKVFCGMAAGVYVLRPEFIDRCQAENQFVCEDPFEWGNPSACLPEVTNSKRALATLLWRKKIEDRNQINQPAYTRRRSRSGAFEDWVAYFACKGCKIKDCRSEIYSQIILAGKGKTTYSLNKRSGITIALFDNHSIQDTLLKQLDQLRIPAVNGNYVFEFLDSGGDGLNINKFTISMDPTHS